MIMLWIYTLPLLLVAGVVFWLMRKSALWLRVVVAGFIWLALPVGLTVWVLIVGDQPPADAIIISAPPSTGR